MDTDVDMPPQGSSPRSDVVDLVSRTPSRQASPIIIDNDIDDEDEDDEDGDDTNIPDDADEPSAVLPPPASPSSASGLDDTPPEPLLDAAPPKEPKKRSKLGAPGAAASSRPSSALAGAKPKSGKLPQPPRSPSPSPPPPPARPPPQTVRLVIPLGGPDNYEVDIAQLSRDSGQRAATPPVVVLKRADSSDESHSEGDDEAEGKPEKKKRRKKKNIAQEYYDVSDPFIDDSELAVDERMYFAQTKQQGFYVSSGQVAIVTDKPPPKKPRSKKVTVLPPAQSISAALSTASLPPLSISTSSNLNGHSHLKAEQADDEESVSASAGPSLGVSASASGKRKSEESESVTGHGGGKKKRKVEIKPMHPDLEESIEVLKKEIAKENWETKGKFPQGLKPLLAQVALKAIILGEYNDNFFNLMPKLFPYNRFTMTKLIKRTIWRDHTNLLQDRSTELLKDLAQLAQDGFVKAKEEYEKNVLMWEKREKARTEGGGGGALSTSTSSTAAHPHSTESTPVPAAPDDTGDEHEHDDSGVAGEGGAGKRGGRDAHPPSKRYRLTERMKAIIWQLVCLSNECCRIENEKNQLENNNQVVSDQGVRKILYQRIVAAFPDGWITSGQVSREVSVMKKKYEKELENE